MVTNHPPSVLWHCWLGHQTCKNRRLYDLYCVGADVKPCSINQSNGDCEDRLWNDLYYSVSQINPTWGVLTFLILFTNGWEFLIDFLHIYYTFLSTLDYKFLFSYPWFWWSYCHIKRDYSVHIICSKCPLSAETHALARLHKSLIALLIIVCGKSL